jgi:protein-disulfide isomerase
MSKGTAIIGMLVAFAVGYFLGGFSKAGGPGTGPAAVANVPAAALPDQNVDRYKVPVGNNSPTRGDERAKVTIIEWSDFQCPFCSRVEPTVDQILKTYGRDVRVVWKNNPLPFHQNALPAAAIAMAAFDKKGKDGFWEMHHKLFQNQQALDRPSLEKYAKEVGLDDGAIKAALDDNKYTAQIKAEQEEAGKFGARGTPAFFINGRPLSGAQPFDAFKKLIDEEIANATKAIQAGVAANQVYDALTKNAKAGAAAPGAPDAPRPQPAQADPQLVYKVPVGNSPSKGGKADAKVTIVQFSDFQCPFCSRVEPTITDLLKDYGKDVRVVWKNNPLPFHPQAGPAAKAALAAGEQGKFWEMHEKIFADQQHLDDATFEKYANELGLNMNKWKASYGSDKFAASIKEDQSLAEKLGARGTPSFFINGRPLRGAQPKDSFKQVIDKEIDAANALIKKGVKPANLYAELTKDGKEKADAPPAPPQRPGEPDQNVVYKALVGDAPLKGAKNAKVTIVEFSDFQCPFCGRVEPTIDKILEEYKDTVRVAFKQLPLPFHNNAHAAAEASLAARAQGGDKKFWEMHKKLFASQQALDRANLEKYAQELGLNVDKFKADLDSGKFKQKVDQEMAEGNKIGARGTPSFFINGKIFAGAQPFEAFKAKIDAELANADAMIKKGVPVAKLYDTLMKDAKAEVAAAPAGGGAPPEDKTVYKVDPGSSPSMGPKNAPVTIVEYSDFQCPFCSRVVPTIKQLEEKYKGKVRVAFKNYPLPFHDKAQLAAEAAMAAHEQGKFWEMHDKLFGNQQALDRPSLEKYAQELGLDMGKFKEALDSGKFKQAVTADMQSANSLGGGMGTPTFFINGRKIAGAMPVEAFASIIDEELKKKGK